MANYNIPERTMTEVLKLNRKDIREQLNKSKQGR